jgi:hypothetical protein
MLQYLQHYFFKKCKIEYFQLLYLLFLQLLKFSRLNKMVIFLNFVLL